MFTKIEPVITEKTMGMAKKNWYTFAAPINQNKNELRKLIKDIFKVEVLKIRTVVVKGKRRRSAKSRKIRQLPDWKKTMVLLKEGQKIDLFDQA